MPAIQLARLKIQISDLLVYYDRPNVFVRELHLLLGFYADRTRRQSQSGKPKPLIQTYNVPNQVIRRIRSDIAPQVVEYPRDSLALADQLWEDNWYECRWLAISILGLYNGESPDQILTRLQMWGSHCHEDALLDLLLAEGTAHIRAEKLEEFQQILEDWLSDSETTSRKLGLRALPTLVLNPMFENLPVFYRLLAPLVRESESALETDLLVAVRSLGQRSPHETAFFLTQNLTAPHKSGTEVIIRRSLDVFPADLQETLREELRKQMRSE